MPSKRAAASFVAWMHTQHPTVQVSLMSPEDFARYEGEYQEHLSAEAARATAHQQPAQGVVARQRAVAERSAATRQHNRRIRQAHRAAQGQGRETPEAE